MEHQTLERNLLLRIKSHIIFIRAASESEVSKLSGGRSRILAWKKWFLVDKHSLGAMVQQGDLEREYDLPHGFNFDAPCVEFVIEYSHYSDFKKHLEITIELNRNITLKGILYTEWRPDQPTILNQTKKKGRPGRPKASLDSNGKITGVNKYKARVFELSQQGYDAEAIRADLEPRTRLMPQKRVELSKIKRILRDLKHLQERPNNGK